jgi:hypothetical protein
MPTSANINKENHLAYLSLLSLVIQLTGLYWKPTWDVHSVLRYHFSEEVLAQLNGNTYLFYYGRPILVQFWSEDRLQVRRGSY